MVTNPLRRKLKGNSKAIEDTKDIVMQVIGEEHVVPAEKKVEEPVVEEELQYEKKYDLLKIFCYLFVIVWAIAVVYFVISLLFNPYGSYMAPVVFPIDDFMGKRPSR